MTRSRTSRQHISSLLHFADHVADRVRGGAVSAKVSPSSLRVRLRERVRLDGSQDATAVLRAIEDMLRRFSVHVTHPRYFGLFNPSVLPETVAAAALVAAYNPQEAVWTHAPAAVEMEQYALGHLASLLGFDPSDVAAHFTSGGQEANLTALCAALADAFPSWAHEGVRGLSERPVLYVAGEGHHSFVKAARVAGLGDQAVRWVPVDDSLRMDVGALGRVIEADRRAGRRPFMVVGTAGTTGTGVIDPLGAIGDACAREHLWFHCDAAWGGGAALSPRLRPHLDGIEHAHSVTWDAHKWMSVPMGAGAFFCRRPEAVSAAFDVTGSYMPSPRSGTIDPHRMSLQWSRRAIGVPVLAALATRGPEGYAALVEHQVAMADSLRARLLSSGYRVVNDTPLPVVCFSHPRIDDGEIEAGEVARQLVATGRAWLSPVTIPGPDTARALRACITSYRTQEQDLDELLAVLHQVLAISSG